VLVAMDTYIRTIITTPPDMAIQYCDGDPN